MLYMEQAERFNSNKLRWSLVDFKSIEPLVRVLEFGANKYGYHNWKKGMPVTEVTESLMRHLTAFMSGEDIDPESKESHIGHIQCNAMFLTYILENMRDKWDDRVTSPKGAGFTDFHYLRTDMTKSYL
jgi:hypothetical protein